MKDIDPNDPLAHRREKCAGCGGYAMAIVQDAERVVATPIRVQYTLEWACCGMAEEVDLPFCGPCVLATVQVDGLAHLHSTVRLHHKCKVGDVRP